VHCTKSFSTWSATGERAEEAGFQCFFPDLVRAFQDWNQITHSLREWPRKNGVIQGKFQQPQGSRLLWLQFLVVEEQSWVSNHL
jgi:hypothetical protein